MPPPDRATIDIYQDTDNAFVWPWTADGVPVDFTGCTANFALRVTSADAAPLLAVSTTPSSAGSIVLTPGAVTLNISKSALMGTDPPRVAHGDLTITFAGTQTIEFLDVDARIHASRTY